MTEPLKDVTNIMSQITSKSYLQIIYFMKFTTYNKNIVGDIRPYWIRRGIVKDFFIKM